MEKHDILASICKLLPGQFEVLMVKLRVPTAFISGSHAPLATRASEVLSWAEQQGRLADVEHAYHELTGIAPAHLTVTAAAVAAPLPPMRTKMLRSTFISYGSPDEAFARKLYDALHRYGVTTFFFPEHAVPGEKLHRMMRAKVNELDRILLVCSEESLDRKGVANEIEETLAREARDGGAAYLIPIAIDDYVFSGWKPPNADTAQAVRDRVVADFRGTGSDPVKFQSALIKLIGALKK